MANTQIIHIESTGYFRVDFLPDAATATIFNLGYAGNVNGNGILTFTAGARVQPGGLEGPAGAPDAGAFQIVNNLSEGVPATMRTNIGLGTVAVLDEGTANNQVASVDDAAGLTVGEFVRATANGIESVSDATLLAALGITIGILDTNIPPVDDTPGLTSGESVWATATGLETKSADDAKTALGLTGLVGAYLLFREELAPNGENGLTQGSWETVPINTEVSDAGGYGSLAANVITLDAGTYRVRWRVCGFAVDSFQSRLWDDTNSAVVAYGSNAEISPTDTSSGYSMGEARFTVAAATQDYILQALAELTNLTNGFGKANNFGGTEVYASIEFERET